MKTRLEAKVIAITQPVPEHPADTPEQLISYCARVSNPSNQGNFDTAEGLLKYCIRNRHWSVFEMANVIVEVKAPRDITRQLLRHDFKFQEFSQRYSDEIEFTDREYRKQDYKNRQNSLDILLNMQKSDCEDYENDVYNTAREGYLAMRDMGVAKECARVLLPEGLTMSTLYVNGTVRNWLHYLSVREEVGVTQYEHVILANNIRKVITPYLPTIMVMDV